MEKKKAIKMETVECIEVDAAQEGIEPIKIAQSIKHDTIIRSAPDKPDYSLTYSLVNHTLDTNNRYSMLVELEDIPGRGKMSWRASIAHAIYEIGDDNKEIPTNKDLKLKLIIGIADAYKNSVFILSDEEKKFLQVPTKEVQILSFDKEYVTNTLLDGKISTIPDNFFIYFEAKIWVKDDSGNWVDSDKLYFSKEPFYDTKFTWKLFEYRLEKVGEIGKV